MVDQPAAGSTSKATYEKAKGTFKEVVGEVVGKPDLAIEGHEQRLNAGQNVQSTPRSGRIGEGMTARDVMTPDVRCVRSSDTIVEAARILADADVGAVPICGEDNSLKGMLTDRDIVTKVIAEGINPISIHVSEIAQGEIFTVDASDSVGDVLHTMAEHQVRRVPVLDNHKLVGIVSQADIARCLDNPSVGELVDALSVP